MLAVPALQRMFGPDCLVLAIQMYQGGIYRKKNVSLRVPGVREGQQSDRPGTCSPPHKVNSCRSTPL